MGIGFAIAVGNAFGVGFAAEIALRRHYFHVFKLLKFRLIDLNLHFGHVADENGDGEQRQVGGGFFQHGGHFGHGDKALCASRCADGFPEEAMQRETHGGFLLRIGKQFHAGRGGACAAAIHPFLREEVDGQEVDDEEEKWFFHFDLFCAKLHFLSN